MLLRGTKRKSTCTSYEEGDFTNQTCKRCRNDFTDTTSEVLLTTLSRSFIESSAAPPSTETVTKETLFKQTSMLVVYDKGHRITKGQEKHDEPELTPAQEILFETRTMVPVPDNKSSILAVVPNKALIMKKKISEQVHEPHGWSEMEKQHQSPSKLQEIRIVADLDLPTQPLNRIVEVEDFHVIKDCELAEDKECEPAEDKQCEPAEVKQCDPAEDKQCEPAEDKQCEPAEDKKCEPAEDKQCEPAEDKQCEPAEVKQCEPAEDKQCEPAQNKQCEPAEDKQCEPVEDKQCEPAEVKQCEPVEDKQCEPVEDKQCEPAEVKQCEPAVDKQCEPVENKQCKPAEDKMFKDALENSFTNNEMHGLLNSLESNHDIPTPVHLSTSLEKHSDSLLCKETRVSSEPSEHVEPASPKKRQPSESPGLHVTHNRSGPNIEWYSQSDSECSSVKEDSNSSSANSLPDFEGDLELSSVSMSEIFSFNQENSNDAMGESTMQSHLGMDMPPCEGRCEDPHDEMRKHSENQMHDLPRKNELEMIALTGGHEAEKTPQNTADQVIKNNSKKNTGWKISPGAKRCESSEPKSVIPNINQRTQEPWERAQRYEGKEHKYIIEHKNIPDSCEKLELNECYVKQNLPEREMLPRQAKPNCIKLLDDSSIDLLDYGEIQCLHETKLLNQNTKHTCPTGDRTQLLERQLKQKCAELKDHLQSRQQQKQEEQRRELEENRKKEQKKEQKQKEIKDRIEKYQTYTRREEKVQNELKGLRSYLRQRECNEGMASTLETRLKKRKPILTAHQNRHEERELEELWRRQKKYLRKMKEKETMGQCNEANDQENDAIRSKKTNRWNLQKIETTVQQSDVIQQADDISQKGLDSMYLSQNLQDSPGRQEKGKRAARVGLQNKEALKRRYNQDRMKKIQQEIRDTANDLKPRQKNNHTPWNPVPNPQNPVNGMKGTSHNPGQMKQYDQILRALCARPFSLITQEELLTAFEQKHGLGYTGPNVASVLTIRAGLSRSYGLK